ncbi:hypothetical protein AAFP30_05355 [Gordonia sp. CPCC 205515]|uniref:hypothetical protein n=1 Tax=Gordonia sp. CPCC 205515 TaxID=3140791 RepID=UPI003AF39A05
MTITSAHDTVTFAFPDVHADAELYIEFIRTLRMRGDVTTNMSAPGIGSLNVLAAADCVRPAPESWNTDDVVLPLWQSEAATISFAAGYPFLVRVDVDGTNAITGSRRTATPDFTTIDHLEMHVQSRLSGHRGGDGLVRQFVPSRLRAPGTPVDGTDVCTVAIEVTPLRGEVWDRRVVAAEEMYLRSGAVAESSITEPSDNWDLAARATGVVRIINSALWLQLNHCDPPHRRLTQATYRRDGLPWFEWYDDELAVSDEVAPSAG